MFDMLRRNMKVIMWFTAGAFVLLIFLAWGAEYQIGSKGGRSQGVIGRINGQPIHSLVYRDRIAQARDSYRQQGRVLDEATEAQIRLQAWDGLVQEMLVNQEIERMGIEVSDQEIVQAIKNQPLPFITQSPDFQTNGQFDYGKYLDALRDPTRDWRPMERYYRQDLPKQKLQQLVTSSVKVSNADVRRQFEAENTKAKVAYAFLPAARFETDSSLLEESDVRAYYESHSDQYRVGEQAWVEFIRLEKKPAAIDTLNARDLIRQAAKEVQDGEDFGILVSAYSEAPEQLQGGETGSYLSRDQYSAPKVREAAFSLEIGEVSGVLEESNGFHLIRVEDKRTTDGQEEVKIADIFVPITLSGETLSEIYDRAVTLVSGAREFGGTLAAIAAEHPGTAVSTAGPFGRSGYVAELQRLGQIPGFRDWAFNAAVGSLTLINGPEAYYVVHLTERRPPGVPPFDEIAERVRADYAQFLRSEQAKERMQPILDLVREGTSLEEAAATDTLVTHDTTDEFPRRGFARGLGNDPAIMARVFSDPVGLVPDVVKTRRGAYVIEILSRTDPDSALYAVQKEAIRRKITQRRRAEILSRWMEGLRTRAEIEDFRGEIET